MIKFKNIFVALKLKEYTLGRAKAVWRVLVDLQASILQGQWISFQHSPTQSFD